MKTKICLFFFLNGHSVFVKNTVLEDLSYLWTWAESSTQVQLSSALEVQASLMKPPWRRKGWQHSCAERLCSCTAQLGWEKQVQISSRSYSKQGFNRGSSEGVSSPPSLNALVLVSLSVSSKYWDMGTEWGWDLGQPPASSTTQVWFFFLLCQESCPSFPGLLLRIADPGTVKHASHLAKPTETRGLSGRIKPNGPYTFGQRKVQDTFASTSHCCWVPGALHTQQDEAPLLTPRPPASESYTDDLVTEQQQ